jgi:hypothetical protein
MRRAKKRVVGSRRMWVNSLRATGARPKKELLCGWREFGLVGWHVHGLLAGGASCISPEGGRDVNTARRCRRRR